MQLCIWYWRDIRTLDTIQSPNFLLVYFGAYCLKEARRADPVFIYCPYLSTSFLLYHSPPVPSQSPSCTLSLRVPSQSFFLYGKGILPCTCIPLPFPQSDLDCQLFFFWLPPQLSIWQNIKPKYIKKLPNAPPYKYLQVPCVAIRNLPMFCTDTVEKTWHYI